MSDRTDRAVAVVGVAAVLPEAPTAEAFWANVLARRYSITEVSSDRWNAADYYSSDPTAPDKTYSTIGGWVRGFEFDWKRFHVPPRVAEAMDEGQQWAVTIAAQALADYGHPGRPLDLDRTGVVLGAAMGGEKHYLTTMRICFPEYARALESVPDFGALPAEVREAILSRWHETMGRALPPITEDSMPGELANILSGRVANLLDLQGPNFITDAACASTFAAIDAAKDLLAERHCDAVLTGGVDRNMGVSSFVKFCKIGALSATGTRPFGAGADGFVMGEGAAAFLLKRLSDAERDGDHVHAVIRGVGASSDGRGKGITAPNPRGQRLAIARAWEDAGLDPATASLVEAHGTSTRVGDVVEVESLTSVFGGAPSGSIALGSVKSNVGHLKGAAGAAGLLKTICALREKVLPPTLNARTPNPDIDLSRGPFFLSHDAAEWRTANGDPRRAGVSAYGFGGTNFHLVVEEHVPGLLARKGRSSLSVPGNGPVSGAPPPALSPRLPLRGLLALGGGTVGELQAGLEAALVRAREGSVPAPRVPETPVLAARERLVVDFGTPAELVDRLEKAQRALSFDTRPAWRALASQGVFRGSGPRAGKVAFLFPGQGSQYVNMGRALRESEPVVAAVFEEADRVLATVLPRPLSGYVFVDGDGQSAEDDLKQTSITQPAVLSLDVALGRLLGTFGITPDVVMGHSLGEYAALVTAGVMPLADALEAAAARGREMTRVSMEDNGRMAAVMAPPEAIEDVLREVGGYVVAANINSTTQCVIGGASTAVERAREALEARGFRVTPLAVSHAFHTRIVAPASAPLRQVLDRLRIGPARLPVVSNVTGGFYPAEVDAIKDLLQRQIASPVQWMQGLHTLYADGVRVFVEVGPKRALTGFVDDVLAAHDDVVSLFTDHPKIGGPAAFNQSLAGLYAAGVAPAVPAPLEVTTMPTPETVATVALPLPAAPPPTSADSARLATLLVEALAHLDRPGAVAPHDRNEVPRGSIVISGTGLGLPGVAKPVMDPANAERILRGEQFVDLVPVEYRRHQADKHITRIVKSEDGSGRFETIDDTADVIKLAARGGAFDLAAEYGVPDKLVEALDRTTQLAMAAGLDALREAGIPLVQTWRRTTTGRYLPDRWLLPEPLRDETGVIFASAFPGLDRFADELTRFYEYDRRRKEQALLEDLRRCTTDPAALTEISRRLAAVGEELAREPYVFDRRFLLRVLTMGHSQFAEYVGARGPNTHVNVACASTPAAISIAEDWIRGGRCRRVVVVGADDVTGPRLFEWMAAGFVATGAAATDDKVEDAALPFDRRRHGMLLGMGACGLVVESQDALEERGMRGQVEVLSTETRNSARHATRLDVEHIADVMESLVASAERRFGIDRLDMAPQTVFVSHETYTPARGGSASAEVAALRKVFGPAASRVVMANTKGFTGHPMGVGIEDVIAVKMLEHGIVPPVPNFREVDPELGPLNLSRGGPYPVRYALHLSAGFGSQIALTLTRRIPGGLDRFDSRAAYARWASDVSGQDRPVLEVARRVLRVASSGAPGRAPVASTWRFGLGPVRRAPEGGALPASAFPVEVPAAPPLAVTAPVREIAVAPVTAPPVVPPVASKPEPVVAAPVEPRTPPDRAPAAPTDEVAERVLAIVAEKTGYPPEMLELDLDLEADLGVDTVKQAETFAAVREAYAIPRQESLKLRDFPTLRHVVGFVRQHRPDLAAAAPTAGPVAAEPVAAAPVAAAAPDDVARKVMAIVAEKTGYPPEMLELDLDLEADLGVDTVKQAETFAAVREAYAIPRQQDLKLRDFPTLRHVVRFVLDRRPDLEAGPSPAAPGASTAATAVPRAEALPLALADRLPRRVAVASLRPPLELCRPTGVALAGKHVLVVGPTEAAGAALRARLVEAGADVVALSAEAATGEHVRILGQAAPFDGVFWLPALDPDPPLDATDLAGFRAATGARIKNLYETMRALYDQVAAPGTFLLSATRMGGLLGAGPEPAASAIGGGVAGFTKAYRRERPLALAKVVDFAPEAAPEEIADALIAEALADPGVVEVGYRDGRRFTVTLAESPAPPLERLALGPESVFVVSGAAGGITSAIVQDLAAASHGTFYLLDLAPLPTPDDAHVARLGEGREVLKATLIEEARARGEKPLPPQIERALFEVERQQAARRAVDAVEAAGGRATYRALDLLDGAAVSAVLGEVRARHGRIDVLLHAAGIETSRDLAAKERPEFDRVFDVKVDGLFNLLAATRGLPIAALVVFGSVAGRFGNAGQTDYSAANAMLAATASHLRLLRPDVRTIAIDWSAWGGIGMATRGSIPKVMEAAGIETLAPEVGIATVRREIASGSGEVVVAGRLGILGEEWDAAGGLDLERADAALAARRHPFVMLGHVRAVRLQGGLEIETTLDPRVQPFLFDHALEGTPLLPGVMATEAFAEAASLLAPDLAVLAVEDERFEKPFKFYRGEPATLHLSVEATSDGNGGLVVNGRVTSRVQPRADLPPVEKEHFRARVRMGAEVPPPAALGFSPPAPEKLDIDHERIYRTYFHGPSYQVLERARVEGDTAVGLMAGGLPPASSPPEAATLVEPRLVELCFQTAGLWELVNEKRLGLPSSLGALRVRRHLPDGQRLWAQVQHGPDGAFTAQVVDDAGEVFVELDGYRTVTFEEGRGLA